MRLDDQEPMSKTTSGLASRHRCSSSSRLSRYCAAEITSPPVSRGRDAGREAAGQRALHETVPIHEADATEVTHGDVIRHHAHLPAQDHHRLGFSLPRPAITSSSAAISAMSRTLMRLCRSNQENAAFAHWTEPARRAHKGRLVEPAVQTRPLRPFGRHQNDRDQRQRPWS